MKRVGTTMSRLLLLSCFTIFFLSCEKENIHSDLESADLKAAEATKAKHERNAGPYEFSAPVYDIAAAPDGSILVGVNQGDQRRIEQIRNGKVNTMIQFSTESNIQGLAPIGTGNTFVTTAGTDLAAYGELYRVSRGNARMVADLAAFERQNDPDAFEGIQWKDQLCEAIDGFSAGPQNNPFKVAAVNGGKALVADAAGNTIFTATTSGEIDWMAIFTPPLDAEGEFLVRWYAEDENENPIPCYVQPVPTSIAVGPDGYIYVGELTGAVSEEDGLPIGLSRVWKIPADVNNVVCTEDAGPCEVIIRGLTSVIDLAIGPDGLLYVVEFDEMSWIASFIEGMAAGGTITAYDLDGNFIEVVATGLSFPSAITFDKNGNLWLLENNAIGLEGYPPTVRMLNY